MARATLLMVCADNKTSHGVFPLRANNGNLVSFIALSIFPTNSGKPGRLWLLTLSSTRGLG